MIDSQAQSMIAFGIGIAYFIIIIVIMHFAMRVEKPEKLQVEKAKKATKIKNNLQQKGSNMILLFLFIFVSFICAISIIMFGATIFNIILFSVAIGGLIGHTCFYLKGDNTMDLIKKIFRSATSAKLDALAKHLNIEFVLIPKHWIVKNKSKK